jgi:hypothetical protein
MPVRDDYIHVGAFSTTQMNARLSSLQGGGMGCLVLATIPLIHPGLLELLRARKTRVSTPYRGPLMDRESRVRVLSGVQEVKKTSWRLLT